MSIITAIPPTNKFVGFLADLCDSNVSMFSNYTDLIECNQLYKNDFLYVWRFGPWLSASLPQHIAQIKSVIENFPLDSYLLLRFGDIDMNVHVHTQIGRIGTEDEIIQLYFNNYTEGIDALERTKIILEATYPDKIEKPFYEIIKASGDHRFEPTGSFEERLRYKKKFNALLKEHCEKKNYLYHDIMDHLFNPDGTINEEMYLDDQHIHPQKVDKIIKDSLRLLCF